MKGKKALMIFLLHFFMAQYFHHTKSEDRKKCGLYEMIESRVRGEN